VRSAAPAVVLMDVRMPDLDGISATRELLASSPDVKVLILTTFEPDDQIFGALNAGASGFLLKRTSPEDLIAGIHTVGVGDSLLSPSVTRRVIDRIASQPAAAGPYDERLAELTPHEREVLAQVARPLEQ
jgi:DNA-binding NarL/FixJ family response regulator